MPASMVYKMPKGDSQPRENAGINAVLPKQELSRIRDFECFEKPGHLNLVSRHLLRESVLKQSVDINSESALDECNMVTIRLNHPWSNPRPEDGQSGS